MLVGMTIPVLVNFSGLIELLNTVRTAHSIRYHIVDNSTANHSVAESWNLGCRTLFDAGCGVVIVANDDIVLCPHSIDNLVDCWRETDAWIVTAANLRGGPSPEQVKIMVPKPPYRVHAHPDFSFFLLPRHTWDRVGEFDENFLRAYFEDNDYHARVVLAGGTAVSTSAAPMYHYGGGTQNHGVTPVVSGNEFSANAAYFQRKWGHAVVTEESLMRQHYYPTPFKP